MEHKKCFDERWLVSSSGENAAEFKEDEEEDEVLSLSDLPLIHQWRKEKDEYDDDDNKNREGGEEEEFDFWSVSKEWEMCAADEVFFQGQILPLRHSLSQSWEKGLLQHYRNSISRSDSMDHNYYSSRSNSMSSGTSSSSAAAAAKYKSKPPPRNHPSPFPSIRNHRKKSSIWNVLRLGLVSTPPPHLNLRSRKSNSSGGGGASMLKKMRCNCAADVVAPTPRVVVIKRHASEGEVVALNNETEAENGRVKRKNLSQQHRTCEWLKLLSVEG